MNFVLHAHLADVDHGDPGVTLGAMLPDLWRMVARPARARRDLAAEEEGAEVRAVLAGVHHHLVADRWFHATPHFLEGEAATSRALGAVPREVSPRLRLFAHVTWEMCLDGALLRRLGQDAVAAVLSRAISGEPFAASRAAELHHGAQRRAAGVEDAWFEETMGRLLDAVRSFVLPHGCAYAEGIAMRLSGVRRAMGLGIATAAERERWTDAIATVEPIADAAIVALLADPSRPRGPSAQPERSLTPP